MQHLKTKEVRIRKPRICWGCNKKHYPGNKMTYNVYVDMGEILDSYWCNLCIGFLDNSMKKGMIDDDGIANGDFVGDVAYNIYVKEQVVFTRKLLIEKIKKPIFIIDFAHFQIANVNRGRIYP